MDRRTFLQSVSAAAVGGGVAGPASGRKTAGRSTVPPLSVRTPCSLVGPDGGSLPDERVAVWSEPSATRRDADGNDDATATGGDRFPLVAVDGNVVGVGGPLVTDDHDFDAGNEEFFLNVWDDLLGSGTVVWEDAHDQAYNLEEDYDQFKHYAIAQGYGVGATGTFEDALTDGDAVLIAAPHGSYSSEERTALREFVAGGGVLFLHDRSDAENDDGTAALNGLCSALDVGFRFGDDQIVDPETNAGERTVPRTGQFNTAFPYFEDRQGLAGDFEIDGSQEYEVDVIDVADGDTVDVRFDNGTTETVRVLGVDTPETEPNDRFERPEEWEGLAYDYYQSRLETLRFEEASSLAAPDGGPLTDGATIAVRAEDSATTGDSDGEGPTVDYDETPIPLVGVDDPVVGFGAIMVGAEADYEADNEEFLINVWNHYLGEGTVLWDESHNQFFTLDEVDPFPEYADDNNYSVVATDSLTEDLDSADGVVITSPRSAFTDAELDALQSFVDDGGALFLHDQADFRDYDETGTLNEIAAALDLSFRFNDDQVFDEEENDGEPFVPVTTAFSDAHRPFFLDRPGFDGGAVDRSSDYLLEHADRGKEFARDRLAGGRVRVSFDPNEPVRDQFDRILAYLNYDPDGGDAYDTHYNLELVENGLARAYGSGNDTHREFWLAEADAREAGRGVWTGSDLGSAPEYRNRPVETVFFPSPASVRTTRGQLPRDRAPVRAEPSATQRGGDAMAYDSEIPLVGVDPAARVAIVGAPVVDENFEQFEGYPVDTSAYENYVLASNLVAGLTDREGDVLIDGGHGQFGADHALSAEDAAYFQRFLEGQGIHLEQRNTITADTLADGRALLVTTPQTALADAELAAIRGFRDDGGAVVLLGSGEATETAVGNLNAVAEALGTDLRLNTDEVTDPENPLDSDPAVFETRRFARDYGGLFDAYDGSVTFPDRAYRETAAATTTGQQTGTPTASAGGTATPTTPGSAGDQSAGDGDGWLFPALVVLSGGFTASVGGYGLWRWLQNAEDADDESVEEAAEESDFVFDEDE